MISPEARAHQAALEERRDNPPEHPAELDAMTAARLVSDLFASWATDTGAAVAEVDADGVRCLWVTPDGVDHAKVVFYLHGGAYVLGTADHVTKMVGHIAAAGGCRALSVDYRLAPEHPFPAAVDDAVAAYTWLLDQGIEAADVVVGGDSAGGGLALALLLALAERGLPMPGGAIPISPWADLDCTGSTWQSAATTDLLLEHERLAAIAMFYRGAAPADDPLVSPVHGDFAGCPPVYVQAAGAETLLDDALAITDRLAKAGVAVTLDVTPGMQHVFQYCAGSMPEADAAIERLGAWLRTRFDSAD